MSLFLLTYFMVYGGMHAYALVRARAAFGLGGRAMVVVAAGMLFMVAAPIMVRMLERYGAEGAARALAHISFAWFGLVFLFFSAAIALDVYRLAMAPLAGMALKGIWRPDMAQAFYVPLAICAGLYVYGYFEARNIRVERLGIKSTKISRPIRIAQVSDIHLGLTLGAQRLAPMVELVKAESPDILVCTGDLVDATTADGAEVAAMFRTVETPLGKYAVFGNHEYYTGAEHSADLIRLGGFTLLRNQALELDGINVAGADYTGRMPGEPAEEADESVFLMPLDHGKFTLLLKHVPVVADVSRGLFDLMLSGHTHKGQMFPFTLVVKMVFPYLAGYYDIGGGAGVYVSRGTGTWGPPIRVFAPPEITIIDLMPES